MYKVKQYILKQILQVFRRLFLVYFIPILYTKKLLHIELKAIQNLNANEFIDAAIVAAPAYSFAAIFSIFTCIGELCR